MSPKEVSIPVFSPDESIERVLVVVAHPDDVDFGSSGTVAVLTDLGVDVAYCLVTSGDAGGDDSTHSKQDRAAIRESEQTAAALEVGVTKLTFLRWPDGQVEPTLLLRREISRAIREHRPDMIITQNPERNYERIQVSHPDHLATGEATLRAIYPDSRNPHAFPELLREGFAPHSVRSVWMGAGIGAGANLVVDVTDTFSRKIAALRQHKSQLSPDRDIEPFLRERLRKNAKDAGLGKGRLAEMYRRIDTA